MNIIPKNTSILKNNNTKANILNKVDPLSIKYLLINESGTSFEVSSIHELLKSLNSYGSPLSAIDFKEMSPFISNLDMKFINNL